MNILFMDFLTILLPTYFFFYMAITLIHRNRKSMLNLIAAFLMLAFFFYFLGEYIKTSLLPQYQMQIVLYGNAPMLLFVICFLVHLCILIGTPITSNLKRWLPVIYASPFTLWGIFLVAKDHRELYDMSITDGRSPLDPLFLLLTIIFVAGYILISVIILAVCWRRTREARLRMITRSLLLSLLSLFTWFILVTILLQSQILTTPSAMILYFIGYLSWAVILRHLIGKHDIMPDYRKLFYILFKSAPTAILLLDKKGTVMDMNPRAKQWFEGIPIQEIPSHFEFHNGMSLSDILDLTDQGKDNAAYWEMRVNHHHNGYFDLMIGLDLVDGANEELFVMHLTDVTPLKETQRKLLESEKGYKHLAHHDSLTNLYNRAAIQEQLQHKIDRRECFALALIDLDNFKPVNDTFGHHVGDLYLQHIAHIFNSTAQPGDLIGRIGGDEFVIVISCSQECDVTERINSRLSLLSSKPFKYEGTEIPISFSAGVSVYPTDAPDVTKLLMKADEAMYTAKRKRKKESSIFSKTWKRDLER
ncbi:sensor domain-containing diguanylate cyclase [Neobacillus mesonae]|nr:sensor domain-containing diguanylate cyclase [Neobacillus mesonae]